MGQTAPVELNPLGWKPGEGFQLERIVPECESAREGTILIRENPSAADCWTISFFEKVAMRAGSFKPK